MAIKISDLGIQSNLADTDVMHLRTTGGIDRQVTGKNLKSVVQGYNNLYMTNIVGTAEPVFTGDVEVNSSLIALSSESGTGFGALATSSNVWVYVTTAGAVVYSATVPSWNGTKGGWYNGNDRAVMWVRKDSGDAHRYKHFLPLQQQAKIQFREVIPTGVWNMQASGTLSVPHELGDFIKIDAIVFIQNDSSTTIYHLDKLGDGFYSLTPTNVVCTRVGSGFFSGATFNDPVLDPRGWIHLVHEVF